MSSAQKFGWVAPKRKGHLLKTGKWIEDWSEKQHFKGRTHNMERLWDNDISLHHLKQILFGVSKVVLSLPLKWLCSHNLVLRFSINPAPNFHSVLNVPRFFSVPWKDLYFIFFAWQVNHSHVAFCVNRWYFLFSLWTAQPQSRYLNSAPTADVISDRI